MSKVGPTTDRRPVPIVNCVFVMCTRVTWKAVTMPVVMKETETRYAVISGSKLNAPPAKARGGETMEPRRVRACWTPRRMVRRIGTLSFKP